MDLVGTRIWPERLMELARAFPGPGGVRARGDFWILLNLVLMQRLRLRAKRYGLIDRDKLQDMASEKALDLVGKLDRGQWNPLESTAGELVSFLSTIARNALIDDMRRTRRLEIDSPWAVEELQDGLEGEPAATGHGVEREEFVARLVACAGGLKPKHRVVWLLRVLYEMPSKSIAEHPEVLLTSGHVDVILDRCRAQIRTCMSGSGLDAHELPPGTFAELWKRLRASSSSSEACHD